MSTENTRLLFTSLHPSLAASHLRAHLAQCPPTPPVLTDVKVVTRRDGTSRCIAFAGFKSHLDAERVRDWATGIWMTGSNGGSRIKVDWAKDTRDADPPAAKRIKLDPKKTPGGAKAESSDSRFQDFLAVMAPPRPSALHDTSEATTTPTPVEGAPATTRAEKESPPPRPASPPPPPPATEGFMAFPNDDAAEDDTLTDAEYLAKRMKRTIAEVEETDETAAGEPAFEQDDEEVPPGAEDASTEQLEAEDKPDLTVQSILETGRLFLRNLAFSATSEDLDSLFSGYGNVEQVHLPVDKATGSSKGLAYVTFTSPASAVEAYKALDGRTFQGRLLHILPAVGRLAKPERNGAQAGSSLKAERLEARKQTGGKAFSWATLYLNSNAALSAVADRLGVSKSALLDPSSSSDPAIKVALAEAHTLGEIKQYFENEGVNVEAFGKPGPRSSTCILVKNLPYGSTVASLSNLLAPFGQPNRLVVPPSGTIAIVEMADSKAAADAWRGLLYKQFGGSVLYLEKAPSSIWSPSSDASTTTKPSASASALGPVTSSTSTRDPTAAAAATTDSSADASATAAGATLFVKNLNFVTTSQRLAATFGHLDGYTFARVQTKPDPHHPGRTLSMGYGFVGFRTVDLATRAKDVLASQVLDGHQLDVRFAQRGTTESGSGSGSGSASRSKEGKKSKDETTTKMLVKNVPFEATRKELRQLFSAYGQLKSVRLPRKMDNTTRGFAFLDFATRRDAEAAFAALEHTHLLGRHLVLQWAGGDDDADGAGAKTQMSLDAGRKHLTHKKSKFTMDNE
ncbi:hypothetical protein JCM11491_000049 [Sporobolomyces phaffii]